MSVEKLLRAFIEAQGYEIEEVVGTSEVAISRQEGINRRLDTGFHMDGDGLARNDDGSYKRGDDECFYLKPSLNVDYKISRNPPVGEGIKCTKCGTHLANTSPLDSCLCKNRDNLTRI